MSTFLTRILLAIAMLVAVSGSAAARPVLMISIDGLRPGDVIEAEARGLKLPNLSRFVREGTYAEGVTGVVPSVTYPSHTTLITGVAPSRHGIVSNLTFDPLQINQGGWAWYAGDIKVPTLWQSAAKAGLKVGNVHWPVSVGAGGISWNLPQIWRTGHSDDVKLLSTLATPGLVKELEQAVGISYPQGIDESVDGDEQRGRFAEALIGLHKPGFLTVYFAGLDDLEHADGPGSPSAKAGLERIDAIVGRLIAAQKKSHAQSVIALVSDHGFAPVSSETSLFHAFIDAGLITLDRSGKITDWTAMPTSEDGSAGVILARPDDAGLASRVRAVLEGLKSDPATGIVRIADHQETVGLGGNPAAAFYVFFRPGTASADFAGADGPLRAVTKGKGTHGYDPADQTMRSTFMLLGKGIPKGKRLGVIDMRTIAPTLAKIMGFAMSTADLPPLAY